MPARSTLRSGCFDWWHVKTEPTARGRRIWITCWRNAGCNTGHAAVRQRSRSNVRGRVFHLYHQFLPFEAEAAARSFGPFCTSQTLLCPLSQQNDKLMEFQKVTIPFLYTTNVACMVEPKRNECCKAFCVIDKIWEAGEPFAARGR
jgi:hypothetical protein